MPGEDAQWLEWCEVCGDMELYVTRGGFKHGGIRHCYGCGLETLVRGISDVEIERSKLSCKYHWLKYPILPYNWHTLTEEQKNQLLWSKPKA